jgi:hypothetical protein
VGIDSEGVWFQVDGLECVDLAAFHRPRDRKLGRLWERLVCVRCSARRRRSFPAVSESMGIHDFVKGRVKFSELAAYTFDRCSNVCPISMIPRPRNEAFVILQVIDRAVRPVATDVRHQQMNDVVFTDGEPDIDLVPIGSKIMWPENELTADDGLAGLGLGGRITKFGHPPETHGEKLNAACFVDEIKCTALESELLVRQRGVACQEHHRRVHAAPTQFG